MKTILWSILCLFLSGWGSMQTVSAQDLQEMEKNLSAINEDLNQKTKEYSWQLAAWSRTTVPTMKAAMCRP